MKQSTKWFLGILIGCTAFGLVAMGTVSLFLMALSRDESGSFSVTGSGGKVAVIELRGPINESENVIRQLKKFRDRTDVKAIVLRVDSPGGGVAASQEIYEEVRRTRDGGEPIVVSMGSVAASGGYYVSCGASRIVANRGTVTGSIGVISQFLRFDPLMKKIGVESNTIKSGRFKDTGNPFREMTGQDRKYLQRLIDDVYRQFLDVVETERGLDRRKVAMHGDGRVFTGEQALEIGLVDTLGTFEDAVRIAAAMGGIRGEPGIVRETRRRPTLLDLLFGRAGIEEALNLDEMLNTPTLQYRFVQ